MCLILKKTIVAKTAICRCFIFGHTVCVSVCARAYLRMCVCLWPLCFFVPGCSLVQVAVRWQERLGGAHREEAGPSCLALSNDLCIMKDGDNISHSLQGSTLWQDLHIHIFFPLPPLPLFHRKLFFLWAGHLPPWHYSGRGKINKYVCREAHDLSRCHRNMARCWHLRTPRPCVFSTA